MAMMSGLRKSMKSILWVLVIAFLATIVFSWGMGGFKGKMEPGVVGKVNKVKITRDQYTQALQNRINFERQRSETELSESQIRKFRGEVWDGLVEEILIDQYQKEANILVTDKEVAFAVQMNPPANVQQQFTDSTGTFNQTLYRQVLSDPNNAQYVLLLEQNTRQQIRNQKVFERIASGVFASEGEAKDDYVRKNTKMEASFVLVDAVKLDIDSSLVTEADIKAEYNSRKEEFHKTEERIIEYVLIKDAPSTQDTTDALRLVENLKERAEKGEDFSELAKEYSQDAGNADQGGVLDWFGHGKMVKEFDEAAFSAKKGVVVGPITTRYGYHLFVKDGERGKGDDAEVKGRHILIKIEKSPDTLDDLRSKADGFREEASTSTFEEAAKVYNLTIETKDKIKEASEYIPGFGRNKAATDFLFNRPVGEISPVYYFRQGWVIMRVKEVIPEGYKPLEEASKTLKKDLLKKHQIAKSKAEIERINGAIKDKGTLEAAAAAFGYEVTKSPRAFTVSDYVRGVGREYKVNYALLNLKPGEITEPIETDKGYVIARLDKIEEADLSKWDTIKDGEIKQIIQQRRNELYKNWIAKMKEEATIEDLRYLYYTEY